jgi:Mn2+/Fe2+ NRAMP family transporter
MKVNRMVFLPSLRHARVVGFQRGENVVRVGGHQFLLSPPLILLVILLTSRPTVMGNRVNSPLLGYLGWATFRIMTAAAVGMLVTS